MMIRLFFAMSLVLFSMSTRAQLSSSTSGFMNPKDTKGLCTTDNREEYYFKEGTCQSLKEALADDKCTAPLLEQLRQKMLKNIKGQWSDKDRENFRRGNLQCKSRAGGTQWDDIVKNKQMFGTVVMQFIMAVAIAESNLDTFYNLQRGAGANINAGAKGGIMNLTLEQMDNPKYNKEGCGCHVTNSEQQSGSYFWQLLLGEFAYAQDKQNKLNVGGTMWTGRSPGPRDTHHSIQCGAYMALVEAAEDGVLFEGYKKKITPPGQIPDPNDQDNKPKGAAKIFASLQDWDQPLPPNQDPNDPDISSNPKLNFIVKKVRRFCERNLNESKGMIRTFDQDFPDGGTDIRSMQ